MQRTFNLFIAIKSAWGADVHVSTRTGMIENGGHHLDRRNAIRKTWLAGWYGSFKFFTGRHKPMRIYGDTTCGMFGETDMVSFPVDDSFNNIGPKVQCIMQYVLDQNYACGGLYDGILIVDDDAYIHVLRAWQFAARMFFAGVDYAGCLRDDPPGTFKGGVAPQKYMHGSCYYVSMKAADAVTRHGIKEFIPDDVAVGWILNTPEMAWYHEPAIWPGPAPVSILKSNRWLSTHKCLPIPQQGIPSMYDVHQAWKDSNA